MMTSMGSDQTLPLGEIPWGELEALCPGRVLRRFPMGRLTRFRVGGPAEAVVTPASPEEVGKVVVWAHRRDVPVLVAGAGSNLLVRDGGFGGLVLRVAPPMERLDAEDRGGWVSVSAWAGLPLRRLVREAIRRGWDGVAPLAGIPGHLGGGIAMNAGTSEGTVSDLVDTVTWVAPNGERATMGRAELRFAYRHLARPQDSVIVEACLRVGRIPSERVREAVRQGILRRRMAQPYALPSAGSVFKNPPGQFAGRIIESVGAKGLVCGGAQVSLQHANFIVNVGGATARDVLTLIDDVRDRVARATGIVLELEIHVVGNGS